MTNYKLICFLLTATLLVRAMEKREGIPREEGIKKMWLKDSKGLIVKDRPEGGINEHKAPFAHEFQTMTELEDMVKVLKPSVMIGAAAVGGGYP